MTSDTLELRPRGRRSLTSYRRVLVKFFFERKCHEDSCLNPLSGASGFHRPSPKSRIIPHTSHPDSDDPPSTGVRRRNRHRVAHPKSQRSRAHPTRDDLRGPATLRNHGGFARITSSKRAHSSNSQGSRRSKTLLDSDSVVNERPTTPKLGGGRKGSGPTPKRSMRPTQVAQRR